jgi:hypothetical protein
MKEEEIFGLYNDDGTKINAALVPKPALCVTCKKDDAAGEEEMLCLLNRNDQRDSKVFKCGAYQPKF